MSRTIPEILLTSMHPMTYYRPRDIAEACGVNRNSARAALRKLARGGVIEAFQEPRRSVYITRQLALF